MSNSSQPGENNSPNLRRRSRLVAWRRPIFVGLGLTVATLGGLGWRAWIYINTELSPQIAHRVASILQRPVELGAVERVSLTSIRFGPSAIPAQAGTEAETKGGDRDNATVAGIEVGFNIWEVFISRNLNLDLTLERPLLQVFQEADGRWIDTEIAPIETPKLFRTQTITVRVTDAQAIVIPYQQAPIHISQIGGAIHATQLEADPKINLSLNGNLANQGQWRLRGNWDHANQQGEANLQATDIVLTDFNSFLPPRFRIQQGQLSANLATSLPLPENAWPKVNGWMRVKGLAVKGKNLPQDLKNLDGDLQFQGQTLTVKSLSGRVGRINWQAQGTVNPQAGLNLQAQVAPLDLGQTAQDWQFKLPVAVRGRVAIPKIQIRGSLNNPQIRGELRNQGPIQVDQVGIRQIQAPFQANLQQFQVRNLQIIPQAGGELRGDATLQANGQLQASLRLNQVPADDLFQAYGGPSQIELGSVSARLTATGTLANFNSLQAKLDFQAPEATYPTYGTAFITPQGAVMPILATQLLGGVVTGRGQIRDNRWQLALNSQGIPIRPFFPDFAGTLRGEVELAGQLDALTPQKTQVIAALEVLDSPLGNRATANLAWDGQRIRVNQATAAGINAQGMINAQIQPQLKLTGLDLQIAGRNLGLGELANLGLVQQQLQGLPLAFSLAGQANIQGRLTGTLENLQLQANLGTHNLAVNQIKLAPQLSGHLVYQTQSGLRFTLAGGTDRLDLNLAPNFWPNSFLIQRGQARATGQRQGQTLKVNLAEFPLELLNIHLLPHPRPSLISGRVAGKFALNLHDYSLVGQVNVARPGLANWRGDQLTANLNYSNGTARLQQGQLRKGNSLYTLQAQISQLWQQPELRGQLSVTNGELADLVDLNNLLGLGHLTPPTFATAVAVQPAPVGDIQAPLLVQIRRLTEIQTLQAQAAATPPPPLPQLSELKGQFNAQLNLTASAAKGVNLGFAVEGNDWQWGQYPINRFTTSGRLVNQDILLENLELQSQGGIITARGQLGVNSNSASLRIQNFPITTLRSLVAFPNLDLTGNLNATATLAGSHRQPQVRGQLTLDQAQLNETPITAAAMTFNYSQGRANFNGQAQIDSPEPMIISGSIPYRLPFVTANPGGDEEINVTVKVKDAGLGFINALTDQVNWGGGRGEVNVLVRGTLAQPIVRGQINLEDATFTSPALKGPLTNVTGEIRFNDDRLRVVGLQGLFNAGQIQLSGSLPLVRPFAGTDTDRANPLTLELRKIQVRAADIFAGEVSGDLIVTDTLRSPDIGGVLQLSQGQFYLTDALASGNGATNLQANLPPGFDPVVFNDLQLQLGENFQILRSPVLNFIGQGELTLSGPINNLQPQGQIQLVQGRLNLFTSLFRLTPGQPNLVTFNPGDGLDPSLDLNLQTTVQEVSNPGTLNFGQLGGNNVTTLGSLTPVRIRAQISGRASQLATNFRGVVQLSSTPGRSDTEILSLLGGGFNPNNQAANQLALVNIASAAVLNNIQANIDDFLSNRTTFRLFPALVPPSNNRDSRNNSAVLALGAEVGYQVTDNVTISAVQLLTVPQDPTRLNVGYQLTDRIRLSTQIGLDGNSVGLIEFRTRF
ncbi:translocation/assembly module TamB domain-containing protein [Thermosynechococcaceae cyanobacterium BACA0444]|uniref:Translocation/assembly module TamB domain-containing protein n=1 Tax=Pseudocalidococcus azoricus BACA0444 TaxID=2918990 RepID=A0AAE4FUK4_9CYAN|nr:translocation/assembly module TamB domain-containing protein [Pseudocalidococcus azoricus]MDS3862178.1 translocation/assembly module TamB domain-containing protein [Pseudocalidococcus azoricus BACA0444]